MGGSWVVTFSIRDRADRDIFRRILGEQVGFVVILFVQKDDHEAPNRTKKMYNPRNNFLAVQDSSIGDLVSQ